MSRIDEALRRAAALSGPSGPGSTTLSPPAKLDDFVVEREGGRGADRRDESVPSERSENARTLTALGRRFAQRVLGIRNAPADAVEHYRRLAALLYEAQVERGLKTLLMTSAVPREGKTTTACNLAAALSESYRQRVLLIDADLRRPSVHEVFGIANVNGLGDALQTDVRNARIVPVSSRLSVLPAGRPESGPGRRPLVRQDGDQSSARPRASSTGCCSIRRLSDCYPMRSISSGWPMPCSW